jgi:citronellol/citronellal dehydrogenase
MTGPRSLAGKTLFITGGSRGIGLAIAVRAAHDGANVVIAAKTDVPHPTLPGTIHTAAQAIEATGGRALPLVMDLRDEQAVAAAVSRAAEHFGGIDILVNNASAVRLTGTLQTETRRYDLMHAVNGRGTFVVTQACLPHLLRAANPHVLTLAPPILSEGRWFARYAPYAIAKYTMSLFTLGWAEEFRSAGVAFNALWPRTAIATAAVTHEISDASALEGTRTPQIVADAAHVILTQPARECTGRFLLDDEVLLASGVRDLRAYDTCAGSKLLTDFFLDPLPGMHPAP